MTSDDVTDGESERIDSSSRLTLFARWSVRLCFGSLGLLIAVALVDLATLALGQQCGAHVSCTGSRGVVDGVTHYVAIIGLALFVISIIAAPVLTFLARAETS